MLCSLTMSYNFVYYLYVISLPHMQIERHSLSLLLVNFKSCLVTGRPLFKLIKSARKLDSCVKETKWFSAFFYDSYLFEWVYSLVQCTISRSLLNHMIKLLRLCSYLFTVALIDFNVNSICLCKLWKIACRWTKLYLGNEMFHSLVIAF